MSGFTRLDNDTDLKTVLTLPKALAQPYLYLLSRLGLRQPACHWGEMAANIPRGQVQVHAALRALKELGLAQESNGLWTGIRREITGKSPEDHREITGKSPEDHREITGKSPEDHREITGKSPEDHREITGKSPEDHRKPAIPNPENAVQDTNNTPLKEGTEGTEGTEGKKEQQHAADAAVGSVQQPEAATATPLTPESKTEQVAKTGGGTSAAKGSKSGPGAAPKPKAAKPEPTGFQSMFGALALACYGGTAHLTNEAKGRIAPAARSLLAAGYAAPEIPALFGWLQHRDADWRTTDISPQTIAAEAPNWRKATARGSAGAAGAATPATGADGTPHAPTNPYAPNAFKMLTPEICAEAQMTVEGAAALGLTPEQTAALGITAHEEAS